MAQNPEFEVVVYPDPVLRKVCDPVESFDAELRSVVAGMFERMRKSKGVGLAAPQVGLRRRVLVLNPTGEAEDDLVLVNPSIVARAGDRTVFDEGCLSFPGIYAEVTRPDRCTVRYVDLAGKSVEEEFTGFTSRIIQHEYDHLEGVLLVDRMSPAEKLKHKAALDELVALYKRGLQSGTAARSTVRSPTRTSPRPE